ncbi:MAG: glycosyltransferase family 2 protein [Nitrospinota bacterium]
MNKQKARLVSIVILTWNRKNDLRETLGKIRETAYSPIEIIVVDNASTDGTAEMVSSEFPAVNYLRQSKNSGIAGYNVGFKAAGGEFVVALDSDSYPGFDAITNMVALFDKNRDTGCIAFDVRSHQNIRPFNEAVDEVTREVAGYHGAGVGFRKELFEKAGYWFEPFFLYFNEMDHALNILKAGYKILHSTAVRAYHKSSPVQRGSSRASYFYVRNGLWLVWRHYPLRRMLPVTFYIIYLAVSESFYQRTLVYLVALRDAFKVSSKIIAEREPLDNKLFQKVRVPLPLLFGRFA